MTGLINLDDVLALGAVGGYTPNVELSQTVAAFLLSVAILFEDEKYWTTDSGEIDESDLVVIEALIGQASFELMREA